jgi:hypothetical protein
MVDLCDQGISCSQIPSTSHHINAPNHHTPKEKKTHRVSLSSYPLPGGGFFFSLDRQTDVLSTFGLQILNQNVHKHNMLRCVINGIQSKNSILGREDV